jgi:hypothetical protein
MPSAHLSNITTSAFAQRTAGSFPAAADYSALPLVHAVLIDCPVFARFARRLPCPATRIVVFLQVNGIDVAVGDVIPGQSMTTTVRYRYW